MIFVDTGLWVAMVLPKDENHASARSFFDKNDSLLVTSDYVIDETLTVLQARGAGHLARNLAEDFFERAVCHIHWVTPQDVLRSSQVFTSHSDKAWSFTDCVSKVVMENLGITQAASFDQHFRQFGDVKVLT